MRGGADIMADTVVVYFMLLGMGTVVVVAVAVRSVMNNKGPSNMVLVHRIFRNATINSKKGRIMKGGVVLPLGPSKKAKGRTKLLVTYYGQGRKGEAVDEVKFWVSERALKKCGKPEWIPLPAGEEEAKPTPEPVRQAAKAETYTPLTGPRYHSDTTQSHLDTSTELRQWRR